MNSEYIKDCPYEITAHGVYRCCKYLKGITFYSDENGWSNESSKIGIYNYKNILKYLRAHKEFEIYKDSYVYNGNIVWNEFFMIDSYLKKAIEYKRIKTIEQLHYYANQKANWK